jgi:hypothetical protein
MNTNSRVFFIFKDEYVARPPVLDVVVACKEATFLMIRSPRELLGICLTSLDSGLDRPWHYFVFSGVDLPVDSQLLQLFHLLSLAKPTQCHLVYTNKYNPFFLWAFSRLSGISRLVFIKKAQRYPASRFPIPLYMSIFLGPAAVGVYLYYPVLFYI